ncbi:MAG: hypothetical protein IPK81_22980 [Rhodospirillales bacterium]|nr:MAG: hypothetical protein IPK81_22980 [Rhodospirillales bacterium]
MFRRGLVRIAMDRTAGDPEHMFRSIPTHAFHVALDDGDLASLRAIADPRARVDFVFGNADGRWAGDDYCYIEDCWDAIHRLMTWHPPVDCIDWTYGEAPLRHVVAGVEPIVDALLVKDVPLGVMRADGVDPPPPTPDGEKAPRTYRIGLIGAADTRTVAEAMPEVGYGDFETGYAAHCPPSWPMYGPRDARFCFDAYRRLRRFFARHAGAGKHIVAAIEE